MSFVTIFYGISFYVATLILFIGLAYRVYEYATIPAPLKIPTPPAPKSKPLVAVRMFREVVFFESLFSATKWTWLFGWLFHFALLLAAFRHLRYFTDPVWTWVSWEIVQAAGHYAGYVMVFGLFGLLARIFNLSLLSSNLTPLNFSFERTADLDSAVRIGDFEVERDCSSPEGKTFL